MKRRYSIPIAIAIASLVSIFSYKVDFTSLDQPDPIHQPHQWSFTGGTFTTVITDKYSPVTGAKSTYSCLSDNDESCFLITVWSGNFASYFNAYRISMFDKMIHASGSELTNDDLKAQLMAGFHEVSSLSGLNDTTWHLASIGMEEQQLYIERPRGTLIVKDVFGLKGRSHEDRTYVGLTEIPQYITVK